MAFNGIKWNTPSNAPHIQIQESQVTCITSLLKDYVAVKSERSRDTIRPRLEGESTKEYTFL